MARKGSSEPDLPDIPGLVLSEAQRKSNAIRTPFMRQWWEAKARYPEALVFFRMGDFYELFLDDAVRAAELLGLTLTARNKGEPDEIPMAGAPHHQCHVYLAKALKHGLSVAIVEQMADPSKCKTIVPREVVRVVTPGLVTEDNSLESSNNHWIVAIEGEANDTKASRFGFAAFDHSTGELAACELSDLTRALAETARYQPREVILGVGATELAEPLRQSLSGASIREDTRSVDAIATLALHVQSAPSDDVSALCRQAAARLLRYAQAHTPSAEVRVSRLQLLRLDDVMALDAATVSHLELVHGAGGDNSQSLLAQLDATRTSPGARLLRRRILSPLQDVAAIRRRHDAVESLTLDAPLRSKLRTDLKRIADLDRLATRASLGQASPRDLGALRTSLEVLPAIVAALAENPSVCAAVGFDRPLDVLSDLQDILSSALVDAPPLLPRDGGIFRPGFDATLDELSALRSRGDEVLLELETRLRQASHIASLKLKFNKVAGWYLEVSRTNLDKVPSDWIRKQTVAGGERFTTNELESLQDKLLSAEDRHLEREIELFLALRIQVGVQAERIRDTSGRIAELDVHAALADVAHRENWVRPSVNLGLGLILEESRHPVVEKLLPRGARFVPNDVRVSAEPDGERLLVITGPNMAGKSTLMRQVALICILAQLGAFVPAKRAEIGIVDRVLTRVGASDNLARGASTFMVEMREAAAILQRATRRSLVVLDELGRGTSTYDGLAIAWSIAEHLHDVLGPRTLFATHYHELQELAVTCPHVGNYSVAARELEGDVVFLHQLVRGGASRSYGVAVAKLAGVPESVLARARAILASLERGGALPSGGHAALRGKDAQGVVQLDMFGAAVVEDRKTKRIHPAIETLRQVDTDHLTPREAHDLVVKLKGLVER